MKFAIFEVDSTNVDRFFSDVIGSDWEPSVILFDSADEVGRYKEIGRFGKGLLFNCSCSDLKVRRILAESGVDILFVCAHRIPDMRIIQIAKSLRIRVVYLRHGFYLPFMRRNVYFFVRKLKKSTRFFVSLLKICVREERPLNTFLAILSSHLLGYSRVRYCDVQSIFPDVALVFSEYWRDWHIEHYGFSNNVRFIEMGSPDFSKFHFSERLSENQVCYCYQTLVEDGRINPAVMERFYSELFNWASQSGYEVVVKGHPRMSKKSKEFFHKNNVGIFFSAVPNVKLVIGHYSSLLPFWGVNGTPVVCVELPGHEIDPAIASWANVVSSVDLIDLTNLTSDPIACEYYFGKAKVAKNFDVVGALSVLP